MLRSLILTGVAFVHVRAPAKLGSDRWGYRYPTFHKKIETPAQGLKLGRVRDLEKTTMFLVINFKASQLWNEMSLRKFKYHLEMRKIIPGIDWRGLERLKTSLHPTYPPLNPHGFHLTFFL